MRNIIQKIKPSFADILISSAFVLTLIVTIPDQWMHSLLTVFTKTQVHIAWFLLAGIRKVLAKCLWDHVDADMFLYQDSQICN